MWSRCEQGRRPRRQIGLSMIEVIAAMVIFSSAAVVLFSWVGQVAQRLGVYQQEQRALFAAMLSLEFAKSLNPMYRPQGSEKLADSVELRWDSQLLREVEPTFARGGLYEVGLYRVTLRMEGEGLVPQEREVLRGGAKCAMRIDLHSLVETSLDSQFSSQRAQSKGPHAGGIAGLYGHTGTPDELGLAGGLSSG